MDELYITLKNERDAALATIQDKLPAQYKELPIRLKYILELIDKYAPKSDSGIQKENPKQQKTIGVKNNRPGAIVKNLFNNNPNQDFAVAEIRDELAASHERGEFVLKSKSIPITTYTVLRVLESQGFIIRTIRSAGTLAYMKNNGNELGFLNGNGTVTSPIKNKEKEWSEPGINLFAVCTWGIISPADTSFSPKNGVNHRDKLTMVIGYLGNGSCPEVLNNHFIHLLKYKLINL